MTFFDFPVYQIPEPSDIKVIHAVAPIIIIVESAKYEMQQEELMKKILKAVGQEFEKSALIHWSPGETLSIDRSGNEQQLVIVFGIHPQNCSLQVTPELYHLIQRVNTTFLFSKGLDVLPDFPEDRRALWMALKKYFQLD